MERRASTRLLAVPESVPEARRIATAAACAFGLDRETVDGLAVAVTEAASNVVRHAYREGGGEFDVEVWRNETAIEIVIRDEGDGISMSPSPSMGAGFGMTLMATLADSLGVSTPRGGGTEIRLRFLG